MSEWFEDLFLCPRCKSTLRFSDLISSIRCSTCGFVVKIVDGVLIFSTSSNDREFSDQFWFGGKYHNYTKLLLDSFSGRPINENRLLRYGVLPRVPENRKLILEICPDFGERAEILLESGFNLAIVGFSKDIFVTRQALARYRNQCICILAPNDLSPINFRKFGLICMLGSSTPNIKSGILEQVLCESIKGDTPLYVLTQNFTRIKKILQTPLVFLVRHIGREKVVKLLFKTSKIWFPLLRNGLLAYDYSRKHIFHQTVPITIPNLVHNRVLEKYMIILTLIKFMDGRNLAPYSSQIAQFEFRNKQNVLKAQKMGIGKRLISYNP